MIFTLFLMIAVDGTVGFVMNTGADYDYQLVPFNVKDRTSVVLEVKACHSMYVLLADDPNDLSHSVYEISIGGWSNTKSVIRKAILGTDLAEDVNSRLDCNQFKTFWFDWFSGYLRVGEGHEVGLNEFLSYLDNSPTPINNIFVSTGNGTSGVWTLGAECKVHGDPHIVSADGRKYTYMGKCWHVLLDYSADVYIRGRFEQCNGHKSCLDEINIIYKEWAVVLKTPNHITINSNAVSKSSLPYITSDDRITIRLSENVNIYIVSLPNGMNVLWDGRKNAEMQLGLWFYSETQGLCGTYNGLRSDDFTLRNGTVATNLDVFGSDWAVQETNVALGKAVQQSSLWDTRSVAEKAVDGCDVNTYASQCCTHTDNDYEPWWRVDLGHTTAIKEIIITRRWDCGYCRERINGFEIYVTNAEDTSTAAPVYTMPGPSSEPVIHIPLTETSGRFVTITVPGRNTYLELCEVEILEDVTCA